MFSKQFFGYNIKEVQRYINDTAHSENTLRGDIEFLKQENEKLKEELHKEKNKQKKAKVAEKPAE